MPKLLIIAGEASGDLLGAHLCQAMQTKSTSLDFFGMGGQKMREAGVDILVDSDALSVVGGLEILKHISKIRAAFKAVKQFILDNKPDLVILIDYPGFNLRMAKFAKNQGCKVFFYVSPQIWAWRYHRIHHIKKYVDHMAVLFAFEESIYQKEHVPVSFVGHPITDIAKPSMSKATAHHYFKTNPNDPVIALFPGSRQQEVSRMMPVISEAIPLIKASLPKAQFILPLASSLKISDIQPWLSEDIIVTQESTYNVLTVADAAIAVSGTVTLEIALQNVPLVILYKMSPISFAIAKRLIHVPYIGLCNLVAEDLAAKELIQNDATPEAITQEIIRLINDDTYRQAMLEKLKKVRKNIGESGASNRAADAAIKLLNR